MTEQDRQWQGWISAWRESGLSQAAFCREHGLSLARFYYRRRRLDGLGMDGFAEVAVADTAPGRLEHGVGQASGSGVRLRVGELVVEVDRGFDEATLRAVLAVATC